MKVTQSCPTLCNPMDYTVHGILQARILEWIAVPSPDLPNPGIEPKSPTLQVDSFTAEPPGKPKNTGVDSPSLLQGIFMIQESNRDLLHCRQILHQLSYQGSPGWHSGKESAYNAGDQGSIPGLARSPGGRKGYPLQYSGLKKSMDCMVHGVSKSRTQLSETE